MKKIKAYLKGGLGNQCFIYAAARALALRTQSELQLSLDYFPSDKVYRRKYELYNFNVSGTVLNPSNWLLRGWHVLRYKIVSGKLRRNGYWNYFCDHQPFLYRPMPLSWRGTLEVDGYWHSEEFFKDAVDALLKDFTLENDGWLVTNRYYQDIIGNDQSAFLHVRSYKEVPGHHDGSMALSNDYYNDALRTLVGHVKGLKKIYVFSDDLKWAVEKIQVCAKANGVELLLVEPEEGVDNQLRDFMLIKSCIHGVIANSSYSWFAGWLGEQAAIRAGHKPIRICTTNMDRDYCPARWIRIEPKER